MNISKKPIILVSSSVYGIEELLERIYTLLTSFGYEVWISHKGTMPVFSNLTAFENCIRAVEKCDLFLGLITPTYGSGETQDGISITHKEIRTAIELNKPRWILAHDHVVFARLLLAKLGYQSRKQRTALVLGKSDVFEDLRVIDMYEDAILHDSPLPDRHGNWVQKFRADADAVLFATAQFSRFQEVEAFLSENFTGPEEVITRLGKNNQQP